MPNADHLACADGEAGLAELMAWAQPRQAALLCSEALWTKCHRRLIADALVAKGWSVRHLMSPTRAEDHHLPEFAQVAEDGGVSYPVETSTHPALRIPRSTR